MASKWVLSTAPQTLVCTNTLCEVHSEVQSVMNKWIGCPLMSQCLFFTNFLCDFGWHLIDPRLLPHHIIFIWSLFDFPVKWGWTKNCRYSPNGFCCHACCELLLPCICIKYSLLCRITQFTGFKPSQTVTNRLDQEPDNIHINYQPPWVCYAQCTCAFPLNAAMSIKGTICNVK